MKKAIGACLLLVLLFGVSVWNIAHVDALTGSLTALLEDARSCCRKEDYAAAEEKIRAAIDLWYASENYTHIMIRHSEVDMASDAFFAALETILTRDGKAAESAIDSLEAHLQSIASMEHISFKSVF